MAKSHPKVRDIVYKFCDFTAKWHRGVEPDERQVECSSARMLKLHPKLKVVDGHIASSGSKLSWPPWLKVLASSSNNNSVFMEAEDHQTHAFADMDLSARQICGRST